MVLHAEIGLDILRNLDDPRTDQFVDQAAHVILKGVKSAADGGVLLDAVFAGFARRGLVELQKRQLSALNGDFERKFFDQTFNPSRKPVARFGELAKQSLQIVSDDARANRTTQKWVDK